MTNSVSFSTQSGKLTRILLKYFYPPGKLSKLVTLDSLCLIFITPTRANPVTRTGSHFMTLPFGSDSRRSSSNPLCRPDFEEHYCKRGFMVYLLTNQQRIRTAKSTLKNDSSLGTKNVHLFYPSAFLMHSQFSFSSDFILFPFLIATHPELWNLQ